MKPSQFSRGGGGALNEVDVTFQSYTFVASAESYDIKNGTRTGEQFTPLSLVAFFLVDGAEAPVTRRLLVGDACEFEGVSEDGLTLNIGNGRFSAKSEAGQFLDSLVEAGFSADEFDDDPTTLNLEPVIGRRFRVIQVPVLDQNGKQKTHQGDGKDRATGKTVKVTYKDTSTRVSKVYEGKAEVRVAAAAKPVAKAGPKVKANGKAPDVTQESAEAIVTVLTAKGGVIAKPKLRMALLTLLTGKSANRDAVIAFLSKDENLDAIAATANISHDAEVIALAV